MRLLKFGNDGELGLTKYFVNDVPPYATLSHTWGADDDEVTFNDLEKGSGKNKAGYAKILFCGKQASKDGLQHVWVDTCCIDKANNTELSEAITSMFRWYSDAVKCYVFLSDVSIHHDNINQTEWRPKPDSWESGWSLKHTDPARNENDNNQTRRTWESAFRESRWFTRGWTLQELIAPRSVEFFSREGEFLGDKKMFEQQIYEITDIPVAALRGTPLSDFGVDQRLRWAAKRNTTRKEDKAYCLLGIFDVYMPLIYGEGENAFKRLEREIEESTRMPRTYNASFQTDIFDEATMKSLVDLGATNSELDMKRIEYSKDPLIKDCYKWILQNSILQEWRQGDSDSLLWINGDPGKGKTMLMIALVRELLNNKLGKSNVVTFFFCQATDPRTNNASAILRGLIWRLAMDQPQVARIFHEKFVSQKSMFTGPNAVFALFLTLSAMLEACPGTFILIDALDECNSGDERDQLLNLIIKHTKSSKAKWLLSSRNYPEIKQALKQDTQVLSLELNKQHISAAVHAFIDQKTSELAVTKHYSLELTEKVKTELINKSDSTFLWVALVCKKLLKVGKWNVLSTLKKLPSGLKDFYARMMNQVLQSEDEEDRDFCLQILRSISLAFRPLSTEELITIARLPPKFLINDNLSELIDFCGSYIIVRDRIVYFIHQSAKDYLVTSGAQMLFSAGLQEEHGLVVSRSLNTMSNTLKRDICNLRNPGAPASTAIINTQLKAISYICTFWVDHFVQFLGNDFTDDLRHKEYLINQGRVHQFLLKHLLHWFEALSLIGEVDRGIVGLHTLERLLREGLTKSLSKITFSHKSFIYDAIRVFRQCHAAVKEAPLQVYCSTLVFSPENSLVRSNFEQELPRWISALPKTLKDWNSCLQTLEGHKHWVKSVSISPDGRQLASGSTDCTVRLWDTATGASLQTLEGHKYSVNSVAFSPDRRQLASGSYDRTVRLWDTATGASLRTLKGHKRSVKSVAFSPDGRQLASGSYDYTVRLWDIITGVSLQTFEGHKRSVKSVVFSPDGRQLASGSTDCTVRLWDTATGASLQTLEGHKDWVNSVAFSPDGQQLASGSSDYTVRLWDTATGASLRTLKGHKRSVKSVAFSPDGRQLASGSYDYTVRLWDIITGVSLQTFEGHKDWVNSAAFSPDGQQLASGSNDNTVRLWDTATGPSLQTLEGHKHSVYSVAFSPDGQQLASGSDEHTVRLWDTATGASLQTLEGHKHLVYSVAFSPDGRQLASGSYDYTVRLWDITTGVSLQTFKGHKDWVNSVAFSPNGQQLASGSNDNTVRLWDIITGASLRTLEGHKDWVNSAAFSPDGQQLASGSSDDTVRLWDIITGPACRSSRATKTGSTQWCSLPTGGSWRQALTTIPCGSGTQPQGPACRRSRPKHATSSSVLMV